MAYTSIWSVKGWLGDVLLYTQDPEKISHPDYFTGDYEKQSLEDVIAYACQDKKTVKPEKDIQSRQKFVSGVNLIPEIAREQMLDTKRQFGKDKGVAAYHGIQSFKMGEVTAEVAHEIGVKLAKQLWGDKYEVLVTTHLDQEHLHNHFVVNTVSFVDGIRYYRSAKDYKKMQQISDGLCRAYGLSIIDNEKQGRSKHYAEWKAEKEGKPTYAGTIRTDVDAAIAESVSERQLWENLRRRGYSIKFGQDITVKPEGKERGLKLERNFGADYSIDRLRARILENSSPSRIIIPSTKSSRQARGRGSIKHYRKCTGLRALYFVYLYKMGVLPRKRERKSNPKRVYFLYREDIRFLQRISAGAQLLAKHKIDSLEDLAAYKESLRLQFAGSDQERKKMLGRELRLCDDIETRSKTMQEKIQKEREEQTHDKRWGRSRTTDQSDPQWRRGRA